MSGLRLPTRINATLTSLFGLLRSIGQTEHPAQGLYLLFTSIDALL
jgi:hypothetical protein